MLPLTTNRKKIIAQKIAKVFSKSFKYLLSDLLVIIVDSPSTAIRGIHNSKITCIEETALNLLYRGK